MTHSRIIELESELADLRAQLGETRIVSHPHAIETLARSRDLTLVESRRTIVTSETSFAFRYWSRAVEGFWISDAAMESRDTALADMMLDLIEETAVKMRGRTLLELLDAWHADRHYLRLADEESTERCAVRCMDVAQYLMGKLSK